MKSKLTNAYLFLSLLCITINCIAITPKKSTVPEAQVKTVDPLIFGNYRVYFNAFNSTFLSKDIAKMYKITRSGNNALINVAVRKLDDNTATTSSCCSSGKAAKAKITGNKSNLLGQKTKLIFKEIDEEDSIYYLAEFKISDGEYINFNLEIKPEFEIRKLPPIKIQQVFYIEK